MPSPVERIVLISGPCSGQIHDVEPGTLQVSALDSGGQSHAYLRTEAVDVDDDVRVVIFRPAGQVLAEYRRSPACAQPVGFPPEVHRTRATLPSLWLAGHRVAVAFAAPRPRSTRGGAALLIPRRTAQKLQRDPADALVARRAVPVLARSFSCWWPG